MTPRAPGVARLVAVRPNAPSVYVSLRGAAGLRSPEPCARHRAAADLDARHCEAVLVLVAVVEHYASLAQVEPAPARHNHTDFRQADGAPKLCLDHGLPSRPVTLASLEGFEPSFSALKGQRVWPLHHRDSDGPIMVLPLSAGASADPTDGQRAAYRKAGSRPDPRETLPQPYRECVRLITIPISPLQKLQCLEPDLERVFPASKARYSFKTH